MRQKGSIVIFPVQYVRLSHFEFRISPKVTRQSNEPAVWAKALTVNDRSIFKKRQDKKSNIV